MDFKNNEFTLLSEEQTFGSRKIDVIKRLGTKCAISDFAILLGGYVDDHEHVGDNRSLSLRSRTGWWYLSSSDGVGDVRTVSDAGDRSCSNAGKRSGAVRPVLSYSNISDIFPSLRLGRSGFLEVEYGEYPQYVVDKKLAKTLDCKFSAGRLIKTGKTYTTDSKRWNAHSGKFSAVEHEEFEYGGKRYVRVKSNDTNENFKLTNGVTTHPGDYFWIEVSPIVWYVDEKAKMLVSKILLASGIRFCNMGQYNGDFKSTEMYTFLNTYFAKEIVPSVINEMTLEDKKIESLGLKDFVLQSIDDLVVNQINNLEPEEEIKYLKEVQDLLNNYTNRNIELINQDSNGINIDIEKYDRIKLDTLDGILDIKERIKEENLKNARLRELAKESKLLNDRIEELSQLNIEQNNFFSKVKVKTLKENKKDIV